MTLRWVFLFVLLLFPAVASGSEPMERKTLTLEVGFGGGYARHRAASGQYESFFGRSVVTLGAGWFFRPDLAVLVHHTGVAYVDSVAGAAVPFQNAFAGVLVEYWPSDLFVLSAGPGYAWIAPLPGQGEGPVRNGVGLVLRGGLSILSFKHFSIRPALEIFPAIHFADGLPSFAAVLTLEAQYF